MVDDIAFKIISCFEHGTPVPQYSIVSVLNDDKGRLQISYGIVQTNEKSNLPWLIEEYCKRKGQYYKEFEPYIPLIGQHVLYKDESFKDLLRLSGQDFIMMKCQDELYEKVYLGPAYTWSNEKGFMLPLSSLAILDSYVHSGRIHMFLRRRFVDRVPSEGGDEKRWIYHYILQRKRWMQEHSNILIRNCVYRMDCLYTLILDDNWNLDKRPIFANGIKLL